jgi:hypothetical protein
VRWRIAVQGQAAPDDLATLRTNINNWDTIENDSGNTFISTVEAATNVNTDVQWVNNTTPQTSCSPAGVRVIKLDPLDDQAYQAYASAHEAGHAHGMRHSGREDNLTPSSASLFPLMGCEDLPEGEPAPTSPRGDDVAQAFNRFGPRATPNWGFENGLSWWSTSSNPAVATSSTLYAGAVSARIPPGGWVYARVRISEPGVYRMVARYRAASTIPTSGTVRFRTSMVWVEYSGTLAPDGCPTLNNFEESTTVQNPVDTTRTVTSTSWVSFTDDLSAITMGTDPGSNGIRGGVWVYNNTNADILVDNVALEER